MDKMLATRKKTLQERQKEKSIKRVFEEYKNVLNSTLADIVMVNESCDYFQIRFTPNGGHYRGQTLILELKPKHPAHAISYPFRPPLVKLLTPVFHTNVSSAGSICVDFIYNSEKWMPTYGFESIISAIILLFDEPEFTQGHYNPQASALYRKCRKEQSFAEFDVTTRIYYKNMLSKGGQKILDNFDLMYKEQHSDREPVGL
ncbi:MAG: ubiquitin-conjugating enzyme E2 variant [Candidatus Thorarchaeota archaeon]